ncbi:MAG: DUF2264 domain-containing protein [Acidobacteria bacterium]|nr:DUF2264 domain-containing protein [Acidobacteriota bacterium]
MTPLLTRRHCLGLAALAPLAGASADPFEGYFRPILAGYLRNARRTSSSLAVCDFEGGTLMPGALARSGKTYDSVSRMMPALAAWVASGRATAGEEDALLSAFRHAFNPAHPDYWLPSPERQQHQRQVESSVVAWSLWVAREQILPKLTPAERANIQAWLASCTQVPVRTNNWAWFTAVNHACRLALASRWPEFSGDEKFLLEDLRFLDSLAMPGSEGWYTDSLKRGTFDYYNFWVFASHFLYWNRMVGKRYPEWSGRFASRLKAFLGTAPLFYGANGSHILFGRSLIYRWADVTPLVLAHEQGLWPHSPGLLRAIVRRNIEYLWNLGGFDSERGKLRETLSPSGSTGILIPPRDPFWRSTEEPLPVERASFVHRFADTGMIVAGSKDTGQVRLAQSAIGHVEPGYRDKYAKFSYSSHFPYSTAPLGEETRPTRLDNQLAVRHRSSGRLAANIGCTAGRLLDQGLEREWWWELDGLRFQIRSRWTITGDGEIRRHEVSAPPAALHGEYEIVEGSAALGLNEDARVSQETGPDWTLLRHAKTGTILSQRILGFERAEVITQGVGANLVHPRAAHVLWVAPVTKPVLTLASACASNPKEVSAAVLLRACAE